MNKLLCALSAASLVALATPAAGQLTQTGTGTATVNTASSGGTATFNFDGNVGGTTISGLTAQLLLNLTGVSTGGGNTTLTFSYSLTDTGTVGSRVSGFGFNSNPAALSGTVGSGSLFDTLLIGGNFPNGIGTINVCMLSNPGAGNGNGCGGGSNGGVANGAAAGTGTFSLVFNDSPSTISLSGFAVRYQSIVGVTAGSSGTGTPIAVPEPATWAMMMVGFGAIGWSIRRRRKVTGIPQLA